MDDDFGFGASVWSSEPSTLSQSPPESSLALASTSNNLNGVLAPPPTTLLPPPLNLSVPTTKDGFDDFDDFGDPGESALPVVAADDEFGDFGDFGEAEEFESSEGFTAETPAFEVPSAFASPAYPVNWEPLSLDPLPSRPTLHAQIEELVGPIFTSDISLYTTDEDIREAEGFNQVLVTQERYGTSFNRIVNISSLFIVVSVVACYCRRYCRLPPKLPRQTGHARACVGNIS